MVKAPCSEWRCSSCYCRDTCWLILPVDTRWNSTYHMLQYDTNVWYCGACRSSFGRRNYNNGITSYQSDSTFINAAPHTLEEEMGIVQTPKSRAMAESLRGQLREKLYMWQPDFKKLASSAPTKPRMPRRGSLLNVHWLHLLLFPGITSANTRSVSDSRKRIRDGF